MAQRDLTTVTRRSKSAGRAAIAAILPPAPFESALRKDHGLDGDGVSPHRYDSACLANLAGCTTGAGDPPPDAAGRTRFRGLAHPPRKY